MKKVLCSGLFGDGGCFRGFIVFQLEADGNDVVAADCLAVDGAGDECGH